MITKVLFIGDPCRGEQAVNIAMLEMLFSPLLKQLDISSSSHISDVNRLTDIHDWVEAWKSSFISDRKTILEKLDLDKVLVIGFETPERELIYLDSKKSPWINIAIHPVRFLDDLYFDISTSFDIDLKQHIASTGLIDMCVQALRVRYNCNSIEKNKPTLGIFGQTPIDKSIYFDGCFKKLDKYLDKIDKLAKTHENIIYKPHPYLTDSDVDDLIINRYDAELNTDSDTYELLANCKVTTACAISSSILFESPYFGIKTKFLENRAKQFGPPVSYRSLLDDNFFWTVALGREMPIDSLKISHVLPQNFLRKVFCPWGFRSDEIILQEILTEKQLQIADKSNKEIKQTIVKVNKEFQDSLKQLEQTTSKLVKQAEVRSIASDDLAKNADTRSMQAEQLATDANIRSMQSEQLATDTNTRSMQTEQLAKDADTRSTDASKLAHDADKNSSGAIQHAKDASMAAKQAHELVINLTSDLRTIKSSWSWRIISPIRRIENFIKSKKLKQRKTCKNYSNLNVAWHTHLYRSLIAIFVKSKKPWHTHLYRSFLSLTGNVKYSPVRKGNNIKE